MVFSSPVFLFFFLPLVLLGVYLVRPDLRNVLLLAASLVFYASGEGELVILLGICILFNFLFGLWISKPGPVKTKLIVALAVVFNLGLLVYFKYASFFISSLNPVLRGWHLPELAWAPVHLPIGVSFFTFQAISYVVDVYRGDIPASTNLVRFSLFKSFFPQLIAGPIVRYRDIAGQLVSRTLSWKQTASGVRRFIIGLGKKTLIANALANVADRIFQTPDAGMNFSLAWLGAICFTLQIYFDFSGYSDMAIGMARMFGFEFLENFNYPYISRSVKEFWRRWHISLSTWFRDYLYKPMGGNRCSALRNYFNLFIVFFLCGLWHGAAWNFVVFGLIHGSVMVIERLGWGKVLEKLWRPLQHAYTLGVVLVAFVAFRAPDLAGLLTLLKHMAGLGRHGAIYESARFLLTPELLMILVAGVFGAMPVAAWWQERQLRLQAVGPAAGRWLGRSWVWMAPLLLILVLLFSAMSIADGSYHSFIYFRF